MDSFRAMSPTVKEGSCRKQGKRISWSLLAKMCMVLLHKMYSLDPWGSLSWPQVTCALPFRRRAFCCCIPAGSSPPERPWPSSREESRNPTVESCLWPWLENGRKEKAWKEKEVRRTQGWSEAEVWQLCGFITGCRTLYRDWRKKNPSHFVLPREYSAQDCRDSSLPKLISGNTRKTTKVEIKILILSHKRFNIF